jgi:hypothetical protein
MLKEAYPGIELGSVDGFQGREKEAVVVSTVRSNADREVGFLGEKRRLNGMRPLHFHTFDEEILMRGTVAMTRPKRHLCVVGDSDTISKYVYPSLLTFSVTHAVARGPCRKRGRPRSASCFRSCCVRRSTRNPCMACCNTHILARLTYRVAGCGRTRRLLTSTSGAANS